MTVDDRTKAMNFQRPEYIPVAAYSLPAVWMKYEAKLEEVYRRYPIAFSSAGIPKDYQAVGGRYVQGSYTDAWGCVWENIHTGRDAIVKQNPLPTREDVRKLKMPTEDAGLPHGFMFLRLTDLRGFEEAMIDFAEEPPELQMLIDIVLAYNLRQRDIWLKNNPDPDTMLYVGDDLGTQHALPISPAKWRKYLKPCFMQIYQPVRKAGHPVYMHTDGQIFDIIPDLVECGVTVINPQFRANGLENLVRVCKGKVCVDLDLDRQLFPFCKPADIDRHVRECVSALGDPSGGLWLKGEIDDGVPLENIEAIGAALEKYRNFFSR